MRGGMGLIGKRIGPPVAGEAALIRLVQAPRHWDGCVPLGMALLLAVFANGLNWAAFHGFAAKRCLLVVFRLFEYERMAVVIVAFEVCGSSLAAEVAVDALVVHVEHALHVLLVSV
ncbi:MAG: hypothetical protein RIS92_1368 [Verrucomicrobiota bacterium]